MTYNNIEELRAERNARLAACDFMMLPDFAGNSPGEIESLTNYRQALRDLPSTYDGKKEVEWPVLPLIFSEA